MTLSQLRQAFLPVLCLLFAACSGGGGGDTTAPPSISQLVAGPWILNGTYGEVSGTNCGPSVGDTETLNVNFTFSSPTQGGIAIETGSGSVLNFDVSVSGSVLTLSGSDTVNGETSTLNPGSSLTFSDNPARLLGSLFVTSVSGSDTCSFRLDVGGLPGTGNSGSYTVGGQVTGLSGTVILQLNGGQDLVLTADGPFTFPTALDSSSSYTVTIASEPLGQACTLSNGSGPPSSTDVTDVLVECASLQTNVFLDYSASLSNEVEVLGVLRINTNSPEYGPGGSVSFANGGIAAYRFAASGGEDCEVIDSSEPGIVVPNFMSVTFSDTNFPEVAEWDFLCSNSGTGLPFAQFDSLFLLGNQGGDFWQGTAFSGSTGQFRGQLSLRPELLAYEFETDLPGGLEVLGELVMRTTDPGFLPGGTLDFTTGAIQSFRFRCTDGVTTEVIDSTAPGAPQPPAMRVTLSIDKFPNVDAWEIDCNNFGTGEPLLIFTSNQSSTDPGFEQWVGEVLNGFNGPSEGQWRPRPRFQRYGFAAFLSNGGLDVTGRILVDTQAAGFSPGGTLEFQSGGVREFRFAATNRVITEVIDTELIANPTPQTIRITFGELGFPDIGSWDFSCSNEGTPLIQCITVQSPTNSGFEQWAGDQLGGSAFPSDGSWFRQ